MSTSTPVLQADSQTPSFLDIVKTPLPLPKKDRKVNGCGDVAAVGAESEERLDDRPEVEAHFLELPDGSLLELVQRPDSGPAELGFLVWSQVATSFVDRFENEDRIYVPSKFPTKVSNALGLRLPRGVKPCPESGEIYGEVCDVIRSYVDLPEASVKLVAGFALSSWFLDKLDVAPYLWISGAPGSGKTTLLRLLHCLCRRAILIAGSIPRAVFSLPASLHPTLLLDELQFSGGQHSHALECWLRAGNVRGVPATMGGELVDGFGAKVLCSRQPVSDSALASRALHISLVRTTKVLQVLDDPALERIADDFQSRLLMFRLQHYRDSAPGDLSLSLFSPRMRDLARALMFPQGRNKEASEELFDALILQEVNALSNRSEEPEALVVIALFSCCHEQGAQAILVGQVAGRINANCKQLGEEATLKARAVGAILKSFGFITEKLSSYGRGLVLTSAVKRRIHDLLRSYELKPSDPRMYGCEFCDEVFPKSDHPPTPTAGRKQKKVPEAVNL